MRTNNLKNKKLLILGSNYSTCEVVRLAKEMGLHTIVISNSKSGEAKEIADETALIDVSDTEAVVAFIKEHGVDGVMTGASEFHIANMIKICDRANLPCYANEKQWQICQNKLAFKELCKTYNVPHVPFYTSIEDVPTSAYPVIIKPIDGCSARGITVCNTQEELTHSIPKALQYSPSGKFIIEKYIKNKGITHSVRYIASNGKLFCEAVGDRYVLNAENGKALITASAFYPSQFTDYYLEKVDDKVKEMFKAIGLNNGALFMEAISDENDKFMFYEMGLRISGGMTYKITEITNNINELRMLIHFAVTGEMFDCEEEEERISPRLNGYATSSITFPLKIGKISSISGVEDVTAIPEVNALIQYYHTGDEVEVKHLNTLDQLFCRVSIIAKEKIRLIEVINQVKNLLSVKSTAGNEMLIKDRLTEIVTDYINEEK